MDMETLEAFLPKVFSDSAPACSAPTSKTSLRHTHTLAGYIDGTLSHNESDQVRKHLATCDACWERYVSAREILNLEGPVEPYAPQEVATPILSKIFDKLSSLLEWTIVPTLQPAYKSGIPPDHPLPEVKGRRLTKTFNGLTSEIFIKKTDADKVKIEIEVSGDIPKKEHLYITLEREDRNFNTKNLNDEGYACFDKLPFDAYRFVLEQNGEEIASFPFEVVDRGVYAEQDD